MHLMYAHLKMTKKSPEQYPARMKGTKAHLNKTQRV